ncbi:MAG: DMT family transporter [Oscillospiraceae bacterium]|jgi:drug/metabolite transporter (DMT)-like permease|nr:DMT family transporter [Oscillospiraceae bacterium]
MRFRDSFHPYAIVTIVFWSLAYVFTRLALRHFTAFPLGFLRYAAASIALAAIAVPLKLKRPKRGDVKWFLAAGLFGFFLYMLTFNKGSESVTAATGSVIIATVPVITALFARVIYRERLSGFKWFAIAVEFSGVVVLTLLDGSFSLNPGLLCMFLAAIALSAYNLLQRKLTKSYTALEASAFSIFAGTLMLAVFLPASVPELGAAPPVQLFYVAVLGVFSSAAAYAAWSKAFAKAKNTSSVSNYMFVTPFLTSLLGFAIAGETPAFSTCIGGAVILFGLLIFNFGDRIFIFIRR